MWWLTKRYGSANLCLRRRLVVDSQVKVEVPVHLEDGRHVAQLLHPVPVRQENWGKFPGSDQIPGKIAQYIKSFL